MNIVDRPTDTGNIRKIIIALSHPIHVLKLCAQSCRWPCYRKLHGSHSVIVAQGHCFVEVTCNKLGWPSKEGSLTHFLSDGSVKCGPLTS